MENKKNFNKEFVADGSLPQRDVDKIIEFFEESGMGKDSIDKIGKYKGWYKRNPDFIEKNHNEEKGKGKRWNMKN